TSAARPAKSPPPASTSSAGSTPRSIRGEGGGASTRKRAGAIFAPALFRAPAAASDPAGQQKHDHDDQQHRDESARSVTPAAAIRPGRNRADQQQDEENEKNGPEHLLSPSDV